MRLEQKLQSSYTAVKVLARWDFCKGLATPGSLRQRQLTVTSEKTALRDVSRDPRSIPVALHIK